ncbi:hypothetical protein EZS27_019561 [termite gut metagenome]|uniref:Uncharacterized protein n=1 Tax=termite gut metagenome TaxID=433724 RepID=A0A5J4RFZ5_9ZZZZ
MEDKTKICCLDVDKNIIDFLSKEFDVYDGSLGKKVKVDNRNGNYQTHLLLNADFPYNLHEYDILIDEMYKSTIIPYNRQQHTRVNITGHKAYYLLSSYPDTIFNPIPFGCENLKNLLAQKQSKPILKIIFQDRYDISEYVSENIANSRDSHNYEYSNYNHIANFIGKQLTGKEVSLCDNKISKTLFESFLNKISYSQTYIQFNDERFLPILKNQNGDIISYIWKSENDITFMLPQMNSNDKLDFIKHLFNEILYRDFSGYFPLVEANAWIKNKEYYLPDYENILKEKEGNKKRYEEIEKQLDEQIIVNQQQYNFLHKILTETGTELVNAIITYLTWLGFDNPISKDETNENGLLEEDIQVDLGENGLLIIEVKGIGGTSKDAECSQINKIKFRRCRERNKFDVYALYVANNERHLPPLNRTIPPFNTNQIQDAINEERGLLYTWQLFNLYFNIQNGFITKEVAREKLLMHGLIDFHQTFVEIGKPYKYYGDNKIVCLDIKNTKIKVGDFLIYDVDGRFYREEIIGIQQEKVPLQEISHGKVGLEFANPIPNIEVAYIFNHL